MPALPFEVVIFDLDGTLVDSVPDLGAALNHTLVMLGRPPIAPDQVRTMVGQGARALLQRGLAVTGGGDDALVDQVYPAFLDYYRAHIADMTRPYAGVERALDTLARRGFALAICTNKLESLSRDLIHCLGWADRFSAIVGGDTLAQRKPDGAPVREAMRRTGSDRAIFVGDSTADTEASRNAGIPCIVVSFGYSDRPVQELGATAVIDTFDDLLPMLERLG
jgi:phosphoglycolate phosphatase